MKRVLTNNKSEEGTALVTAAVGVAVMAGMAAGIMIIGASSSKEQQAEQDHARSLYVAQSGISDALSRIAQAEMNETLIPTKVGEKSEPVKGSRGAYWVGIEDNGDGTFTLTSNGHTSGGKRALEVVVRRQAAGAFANAIYAGNSGGDPNFSLEFAGTGAQADIVNGNVYSGNDIQVDGDATVNGILRADGSIGGAAGMEGISQPPPDLLAMDYENIADVDVSDEFASGGAEYKLDSMGGRAWQLQESNPAHIFRVNPSDRSQECNSTAKQDYFLEDPYETPNSSPTGATKISLSGAEGKPGTDGSDKVYFIDGNLWIHNKKTFGMKFYDASGDPIRVTFVVKGNIYLSDNLYYEDSDEDGLALIAMGDESVEDSGNIYFGDPAFSTLDHVSGFMYAENNFHDVNLTASGNSQVTVDGNMSCGNQFKIQRTFGGNHTKLTVNYDDRLQDGSLVLPALPIETGGAVRWEALSWREVQAEHVNASMAGILK